MSTIVKLPKGTFLYDGKYRILSSISKGGFGITYIAMHISENRRVCIKELFISTICKRDVSGVNVLPLTYSCLKVFIDFKSRFIKEANTLMHLNHPGIIKVEEIFEENGTAYYVMEYVEGRSLLDLIPEAGVPANVAEGYIRQLASAVNHIHQCNISHLDIKPANILVKPNHRLILIDFGGSKRYNENGEQTSSAPLSISEGYAPLELYFENAINEFSPTTDIYEIGATFYHLVSGKKPPCASEVLENGIKLSPSLPDNIVNTILSAMHPDRKKRLQTIEEFFLKLNITSPDSTDVDSIDDASTIYDHFSKSNEVTLNAASSATEYDSTDNGQTVIGNPSVNQTDVVFPSLDEIRGITPIKKRSFKMHIIIGCIAVFFTFIVLIFVTNISDDYDIDDSYEYYVENAQEEVLSEEEILANELQQYVNAENSKDHQFQFDLIRLDSISLDEKEMTFYFCMNNDAESIYNDLRYSKNARKDYVISDIKHNAFIYNIAQKLSILGRKLTFKFYMQSNPTRKIETTLTAEELESIPQYDGSNENKNKSLLKDVAENISKKCPQTLDSGLIMQKCEFNGSELIYFYTCSDEYYNYIKRSLQEIKNDIVSQFDNAQALKLIADMCAQENVDITYIYRRKSNPGEIKIIYNCQTKSFN